MFKLTHDFSPIVLSLASFTTLDVFSEPISNTDTDFKRMTKRKTIKQVGKIYNPISRKMDLPMKVFIRAYRPNGIDRGFDSLKILTTCFKSLERWEHSRARNSYG